MADENIKSVFKFIVAIAISTAAIHFGFAAESLSDRTLTDGWQFMRDGGSSWVDVRVPHDWAIAGPFDETQKSGATGKLPWKGKGRYRYSLEVSPDEAAVLAGGGRAYLKFDGVMASPCVKINGTEVGGWDYGYMSFVLDVTDAVKVGANKLEVSCDTTHHKSRWYPGAGIYRRVVFSVRPKRHVLPGTLAIETPVVSKEAATVRVRYSTFDGPTNETFIVNSPRLWDVNDPYLYDVKILGEKFRYGIRTFKFMADDGFHLNGRRVQLKGVNLHADLGILGMAFDKSAMRRQLHLMKEMGCNAVRTSHNAPAPEMLDLCDEMGLLVWDECFDKWEGTSGRRPEQDLEEYVIRNLRQFVRRDRNHPSVVVWSISNEIWEWDPDFKYGKPESEWWARSPECQTKARNSLFAAAVRLEDPTRPVACGNRPFMNEKRILDMDLWKDLDVVGWNYYRSYVEGHLKDPKKPVVYSESSSAFSSYGHYDDLLPQSPTAYERKSGPRQVDGMDLCCGQDIADVEFDYMETDRYVAGEFIWTGIDYIGEPAPYNEDARSSYFGCVDLTGVPKDRFYLYRSHWNPNARTLHVVPHWNWQCKEKEQRAVFVYTDGDEGELFLNGRSLGRRRKGDKCPLTNDYYAVTSKYRLMWTNIAYEPGEIKAIVWKNGKKLGEKVVRTAGEPKALKAVQEPLLTNESDELRWVQVDALDANGVRNPLAMNRIYFHLDGPGKILAVGNGNPMGMKSFAETDGHDLFYGKATLAIRREKEGKIELRVTSDALLPELLEIR